MQFPLSRRDPIGHAFARLTAQLEDACELAVQGQNAQLSLSRRAALARRLRLRSEAMGKALDRIDSQIASRNSRGRTPCADR
jgi:hypothetical protein